MAMWFKQKGPESDVVVSSRVRLARNLSRYPFPFKMDEKQQKEVIEKVVFAVKKDNERTYRVYDIKNMDLITKVSLVEKHLISRDMAQAQNFRALIISEEQNVSLMVNEEDHIRLQCILPGMQISEAWKLCDTVDTVIEKEVDYAFDKNLGYLTSCPTHLGTGIRSSVMLHRPALTMTGYVGRIFEACSKLGVAVRGLYGENSEASGDMFQISNQVTLGQNEEEIVKSIENIATQIISQERMLREELYKQNKTRFEDKIMRSYGIIRNARIMSSEEAMKLLSDVRLGVYMGIIKDIRPETLNEMLVAIQPASLQKRCKTDLNPEQRDIIRAEVLRNIFSNTQDNS